MSDLLSGIFECLDIDSNNGLASDDNIDCLSSFQKLFYKQVREKIGANAVYFLRDIDGNAKIPLIYFSIIQKHDFHDHVIRVRNHTRLMQEKCLPLL